MAKVMHDIRVERNNRSGHAASVPPAHAAFMTYLALDVMFNDLSSSVREAVESDCDYLAVNHKDSWRSSKYGVNALKELYHNGKTAAFEMIKNDYRNYILDRTTEDGVYATGPGYTKSRIMMDNRIQKKIFMDICEYQGYHEFYGDPKFQNLYEWTFGYSVTPFNRTYTFGDSPPTKRLDHWAATALRANRFSEKAQRYASWRIGPLTDDLIKGSLLHYVLSDAAPKSALRPVSRIFKNGGAWLLEDSESERALAGALWNINTVRESHNHLDVNAIHIAAYGEHILRNSGYDGWGKPDAQTWEWIRRTAESSNTVLVNNSNHTTSKGAGIIEGLLGKDLEYACGDAGDALQLAQHKRNLFLVKPRQGNHGYFVVIDEVDAALPSLDRMANVVLHPNSSLEPVIIENEKEYRWTITGCNYSGNDLGVTIFLGTIPLSVSVKTGYKGSYHDCSRFEGKYIYSTYDTNDDGKVTIVSVIFPHDQSHPVANMNRISTPFASGAVIDHGDSIVDHALGSLGDSVVTFNDISFKGLATVYREEDGNNRFYFVRKGVKFDDGSPSRQGFDSDSEISLFIEDKDGQIISPGTDITFYYPEITGMKLDGALASVLTSGSGWVKIHVEKGTHDLHFTTHATGVNENPMQVAESFELLQNYPNPFNSMTTIRYELSQTSHVQLTIYNLLGHEIKRLVDWFQSPGAYRVTWDGRDLNAKAVNGGVYIYRLEAGDYGQTHKMVLLR